MKRLKEDLGASTTILGLSLVIVVLFIAVFIVDYTKNIQVSNMYQQYAQLSTEAAIKEQSFIGGLKYTSAEKLVDEYMALRSGKYGSKGVGAYIGSCQADYPHITITYDRGRGTGASGVSFYSTNGVPPIIPNPQQFNSQLYNVIQVEIVDVTHNFYDGLFGYSCTKIVTRASAIMSGAYDE